MITMKEATAALNGDKYGEEGSDELFEQMREAGLVAVFGCSDDLMLFMGAVHDEASSLGGGKAYFNKRGQLWNDCEDDDCPHFAKLKDKASVIEAVWCPDGEGVSWLMKTNLPHEPFMIVEGDDVYCVGLVFSLADCAD